MTLIRKLEGPFVLFVLALSAGAFGFVDVVSYGGAYSNQSVSTFSQVLWPLTYLAAAALFALHAKDLLEAAIRNWVMLVWPMLAVASILWSIDQGATLNAAARLAVTTFIGLYIGTRFDLLTLLKMVFAVLLAAGLASILAVLASLDFAVSADGARGVFHHKNTLGARGALLFATALLLFVLGWKRSLSAVGIVAALVSIILSRSATAIVLAATLSLATPIMLSLRRPATMAASLLLVGWSACLAALITTVFAADPITGLLDALGKDITLTGRSLLWEAAWDNIAARPALGTGYDAFWDVGLDWETLQVLERLGHVGSFHNAFLEIGVQLGLLGLAAAILVLLSYFWAALKALWTQKDPVLTWPLLFGTFVLILGTAEVSFLLYHSLQQILLVASFAAVGRSIRVPAAGWGRSQGGTSSVVPYAPLGTPHS